MRSSTHTLLSHCICLSLRFWLNSDSVSALNQCFLFCKGQDRRSLQMLGCKKPVQCLLQNSADSSQ
jgi:hypothetical protein